MTFVPRQSVREGLDYLEVRLDPIIANRLAPILGGLPWTAVLTELDVAKGKTPGRYSAADVQCQLRMLTERLGKVGYPFDDDPHRPRYVSSLASELRIMRNAEKHNDEISTADAWRFHDTVTRLLAHFDDADGLPAAVGLRATAFEALAEEVGLGAAKIVEEKAAVSDSTGGVPPSVADPVVPDDRGASDDETVTPDSVVLVRDRADATPTIGGERQLYEPWEPVRVGDVDVIDAVARKGNKNRVRAVATEIVEFEGPIHIDRLVGLVAASFGTPRLTEKRRQKVERQVRQLGLLVDADKFLWPADLDPATWMEFRPNDSNAGRDFTQISPIEIRNAMRFIGAKSPAATADEIDVAALATFGRKRRTHAVLAHLNRVRGSTA